MSEDKSKESKTEVEDNEIDAVTAEVATEREEEKVDVEATASPVTADDILATVDELTLLKARADAIGFKYHHRVKSETLKVKLAEFLAGEDAKAILAQSAQNAQAATPTAPIVETATIEQVAAKIPGFDPAKVLPETDREMRGRMLRAAGKLIRVRVTNMNPNKKDWEGEIYTVSNALGTFKKYVPFAAEDGWHVPQIILNVMIEKEFQAFHTVKGPNGQKRKEGKLIKELAIEILEPLNAKELKDLGQQQALAAGQAA